MEDSGWRFLFSLYSGEGICKLDNGVSSFICVLKITSTVPKGGQCRGRQLQVVSSCFRERGVAEVLLYHKIVSAKWFTGWGIFWIFGVPDSRERVYWPISNGLVMCCGHRNRYSQKHISTCYIFLWSKLQKALGYSRTATQTTWLVQLELWQQCRWMGHRTEKEIWWGTSHALHGELSGSWENYIIAKWRSLEGVLWKAELFGPILKLRNAKMSLYYNAAAYFMTGSIRHFQNYSEKESSIFIAIAESIRISMFHGYHHSINSCKRKFWGQISKPSFDWGKFGIKIRVLNELKNFR